jgi:DNA (cytosine-5)-methyltransferase 1
MYLRTKYAWYILDMPSATYSPFFTGFWLQHRVLHLVVTAAMTNARITFDAFIASLKVTPETSDAIAIPIKILGRELTEDDVESDDVVSLHVLCSLHATLNMFLAESVPPRNFG